MANILKLAKDFKTGLQASLSKENIGHRSDITKFALSSEDMDSGEVELATAGVETLEDIISTNIRLLTTSNEEDITFTDAQIAAATSIARLALDPKAAMSAITNPRSVEAPAGAEVLSSEADDMIDGAKLSVEGFDGASTNNAIYFSVLYNLLGSKQDEFGELFYPTIAIDPLVSGINVSTEFTSFYTEIDRSISGSADRSKYNKVRLIDAIFDETKFGVDKNKVVPVKRPENAAVLFQDYEWVDTSAGEAITTAPIVFGKEVGLLGISQTDALLAKGTMDSTDTLDRTVTLEDVFFQLTADVSGTSTTETFSFNAAALPGSNFTYSTQEHEKDIRLIFDNEGITIHTSTTQTVQGAASAVLGTLPANHTIRLRVKLHGDGNINYGDVGVYVSNVELAEVRDGSGNALAASSADYIAIKAVIDGIALKGYTLDAYRSNLNVRTTGQLITSDSYNQIINVPLRSGISVKLPVNNATGSNNDSKLVSQLQILGIKTSMYAVMDLISTTEKIAAVSDVAGTDRVFSFRGIGRYLVNPYYSNVSIDLAASVDSIDSVTRLEAIKASVVSKLRDEAIQAAIESGYKIALDTMNGSGSKLGVIVGCDPRLKGYIASNGTLDFGSDYDVRVASTLNPKIKGKIFLTFGVFDSDRNTAVNPLNYGNCLIAPTISTDITRTVGGSTYRVLHNMPRFVHAAHLPIMVEVDVSNIDAVLGKVAVNMHAI